MILCDTHKSNCFVNKFCNYAIGDFFQSLNPTLKDVTLKARQVCLLINCQQCNIIQSSDVFNKILSCSFILCPQHSDSSLSAY